MNCSIFRAYFSLEMSDIEKYIDKCTPRERKILEMRYGLGDCNRTHTLKEIGEYWNRSGNRIRQIEAKTLRKIKRLRELHYMNEIVNKTNMQWNLLSDDCLPPINKPVIVKDNRGSLAITRLKYIWEHDSRPIYCGNETTGTYWMPLPDIEATPKQELINRLLTPIENLELTVRSIHCLKAENIRFVGDIVCNPKWEVNLLKTPNFGRKSYKELQDAIIQHGFQHHEECPEYFKEREKHSPNLNKEMFM